MPQGRTRDVAAQPFEGVPRLGAAPGVGMQVKTLDPDTALWVRCLLTSKAQRGVFPCQHFLPRTKSAELPAHQRVRELISSDVLSFLVTNLNKPCKNPIP